ncbi:hypothetical protein ACI2OX_14665 [Bacillus sp. N9]
MKFTENFEVHAMALAAIVGVLLNLVLPGGEVPEEVDIYEVQLEDEDIA